MATATDTVKTPVQMTDGRTVEFTSKQKLNKSSTIGEDGSVTGVFDFRNGETRTFTIPAELLHRFAAHGMEQKLGDSIAGETDLDDAVLSFDDLLTRLNAGEWNVGRSGSGGSFAGSSVTLKALFEVRNAQTDEEKTKIKDWFGTKTQAEKLALRRMDAIAPIVARLEAEKASSSKTKSSVDAGALFGELDAIGGEAPAEAPASRKAKPTE